MANETLTVVRLFCFVNDGFEDICNPGIPRISEAVKSLDGGDIDTVSITLSNGDSMDIGGGKDNKYKCHARTNGGLYDLINPKIPCGMRDTVGIMMNQEGNSFPKCCIVSLDLVLMAIETFGSSGLMDPRLTWDNTLEYEPL